MDLVAKRCARLVLQHMFSIPSPPPMNPSISSGPESIVTSLEWSKKLKEAGWERDAAHWYWNLYRHSSEGEKWFLECPFDIDVDHPYKLAIAAPTAEEILRRLPFSVEHKVKTSNGQVQNYVSYITPHREKEGWQLFLRNSHRRPRTIWVTEILSLANAAAACYCYLEENNLFPS